MGLIWPNWMTYEPDGLKPGALENASLKTKRQAARDVLTAVNGIALLGPDDGVVWRGQGDIDWRLESKAARLGMTPDELVEHETAMIKEARRIGAEGAQHMGDWEILAKMRHHGAATRLIDVTTDPMIALWFLCDDDADTDDGNVRDKTGLLLALQRNVFTPIKSPHERESYKRLTTKERARLIYSTPPIDPRIAAQRGLFVLHSHPVDDTVSEMSELGDFSMPSRGNWKRKPIEQLEAMCGPKIPDERRGRTRTHFPEAIGVVVPPVVKEVLLKMLEVNFGFTRSTIYPDFSGIGQVYATKQVL